MATFITVESKNGKSIKAYIRIKGYRPRCKTFSNITLAKKWAKQIETSMENGTYKEEVFYLADVRKRIKTVKDLILYFKENVAPKKYVEHLEKYYCMYDWWIEQIGDINLVDLTTSTLSMCKQKLINTEIIKSGVACKYSNSTINKYLFSLSAILKWAMKETELISTNPMSNVEHMKKLNERTRRLTNDEETILLNACKNHSMACLIFFLLLRTTGGRYSEVLNLMVETIDFINSRVVFLDTKNDTNRSVAIDLRLLELIKNYLENNGIKSGYIFIGKNGKLLYMRGILGKIIKDNHIEDCHIHDLRHTFASTMAEQGASIYDIMVLLGHKSTTMAKRYTHLTQKYQDKVVLNITSNLPIWSGF